MGNFRKSTLFLIGRNNVWDWTSMQQSQRKLPFILRAPETVKLYNWLVCGIMCIYTAFRAESTLQIKLKRKSSEFPVFVRCFSNLVLFILYYDGVLFRALVAVVAKVSNRCRL